MQTVQYRSRRVARPDSPLSGPLQKLAHGSRVDVRHRDGVIGPTLCYRFKEFVFEKTESRLDLTVLGVVPDLRGRACAATIAELRDDDHRRGKPFWVTPPMADPFSIFVHQPNGSTLEKSVRVKGE